MENIDIIRNGEVVTRVSFGTRVSEAGRLLDGNIFIIYDPAVEQFASELRDVVNSGVGRDGGCVTARVGGMYAMKNVSEEGKILAAVEDICRWLLVAGADRDACLVAVGGGIVSDMVGFAAAIYKRGVRAANVPTTLLAQVDAAIGGKTGVNLDAYKNIIGVFKQPEITFICPEVLETLPEAVFRAGLAEMLKTFIIDNGVGAGRVERMMAVVEGIFRSGGFAAAGPAERADFGELVAEAARVKAGVVSRDEHESGERRKLNLGHTFAHAIEYVANSHTAGAVGRDGAGAGPGVEAETSGISHGDAVAIGIAMAARLSVALGIASPQTETAVLKSLKACALPTECPFPMGSLLGAMTKDKKAEGGRVHFILIRSIGDVIIRDLTVARVGEVL